MIDQYREVIDQYREVAVAIPSPIRDGAALQPAAAGVGSGAARGSGREALEAGTPLGLCEALGGADGDDTRAATSHLSAVVPPVAVVEEEHLVVGHPSSRLQPLKVPHLHRAASVHERRKCACDG
jgi:hypothetical protein